MKPCKFNINRQFFKVPAILLFTLVIASFKLPSVITPSVGIAKSPFTGRQSDSLNAATQLLLTASATDFHAHQPPVPIEFRQVKVGYLMTQDRQKQYILCGEFLSLAKKQSREWTPFATIKTSSYEQWIGRQALPFCQDPAIKWAKLDDLASALKRQLDSLR